MASPNPTRDFLTVDDHDFSRDLNGSLAYSPDRPLRQGNHFNLLSPDLTFLQKTSRYIWVMTDHTRGHTADTEAGLIP